MKTMVNYLLLLLVFNLFNFNELKECLFEKEQVNTSTISPVVIDFYVSPAGNDSNTGTLAKPFATLERAKLAVRNSLNKNKNTDYSIWLADGKYVVTKPVVFEPADSGNGKVNVVFKAMKDAAPVVSGGVQIIGWQQSAAGLWLAQLPEKKDWNPRELFIDNKRATWARFPNKGYLHVKQVGEDRRTNFFFNEGDFPIPKNVNSVELVLLHDWSISRIAVKEINANENKLTAVDSIGAKSPDFFNLDNWNKNPRYFLENAIEFLDSDYEWFYNPEENKMYLQLPKSVNPEKLEITAPFSKGLISIEGNENQHVKNIHFEGIAFRNCAWNIPEMGYCGVQACYFDPRPKNSRWSFVPAAVNAVWAENCTFLNCAFENLGGSGLWFSTGCKSCKVTNSNFYDISGNGIMIGEGRDRMINGEVWWKSAPGQVALGNTIEKCIVNDCGKQFFGAVGIWCGLTAETTIRNSEIYGLPYSGISIGWMWSSEPTPCRDNIIDGNHIHHVMQTLSDGGGIYMLGLQPGSKIENNHIHDVKINAGRAESNGMFLDEGITDVTITNNLIYNIAKSPLRFHKATTNLVKGNYLFCTNGNPPIRYNRTEEKDIQKVGNKVFNDTDRNYKEELNRAISRWTISK